MPSLIHTRWAFSNTSLASLIGGRTFPMSSWASPPGWHPGRSPEVLIESAVEECANLVQLLWNFTSLDLYSGFPRDKCWLCYMSSKPFCDFIYHSQGLDILRNCCHTVRLLYGHMLIPSLGTVVSHSTTKCVWKNSILPVADVPCEGWVTSSFGMRARCQDDCESYCTQHHTLDINSLRWCEQGHSFAQTLRRKQVGWKDNSIKDGWEMTSSP